MIKKIDYLKRQIEQRDESMKCKIELIKLLQDNQDKLLEEKQNVIEKIEERLKELKSKSGGNTYHVQAMINAKVRELEWVLSILKRKNNQDTVK